MIYLNYTPRNDPVGKRKRALLEGLPSGRDTRRERCSFTPHMQPGCEIPNGLHLADAAVPPFISTKTPSKGCWPVF